MLFAMQRIFSYGSHAYHIMSSKVTPWNISRTIANIKRQQRLATSHSLCIQSDNVFRSNTHNAFAISKAILLEKTSF
jgi:hypothetical protein